MTHVQCCAPLPLSPWCPRPAAAAVSATRRRRGLLPGVLLLGLLGGGGCKELTGSPGLPSGTPNPSVYNNATGAVGMRNAAVFAFEQALHAYIIDAGLLTDELDDHLTGASPGVLLANPGISDGLDERILPEGVGSDGLASYQGLQRVRGLAAQALGALAAYDTSKVRRGELYAFEGYAELLLADLFCSGVPLSTLDYQQDFTYAPGSTTAAVYQAAKFKFDTALALGRGSDSVRYLAQVGQGRANLALGRLAQAADDVTTVPSAFQYQVAVKWGDLGFTSSGGSTIQVTPGTLADREGGNGLPFRSSDLPAGDPRTAALGVGVDATTGDSLYYTA
jgi:hypothetical protein